jgi:two-component system OmpR family sensor kinase
MLTRLPIRLRLAIAFALAMAALLAVTGWFLYARLGADLAQAVDQGLRQREDDLAALVRQPGFQLNLDSPRLVERGEIFAQVLDGHGRVLESTPLLGTRSLLSSRELAAARRGTVFTDRPSVPGLDEPARLLAAPVPRGSDRVVLVVGTTRQNRTETLGKLRNELLIGGPLALLATSLAGYLLAGAALRPVEAMRRRAAAVTANAPGQRLPLPGAKDELFRLGTTLNDLLCRLEAALERERSFVADASHELRTPLALLKTELELALRRPRTPEDLRAAIASAAEETDHLTRLAEKLLMIAGADSGRLPLQRQSVSATELLQRSTQRFSAEVVARGRRLRTEVDGEPGMVVVDPVRMEQALSALMDNAMRHGAGDITACAVTREDTVELHVIDAGPGFPVDYLERAFERFSRPAAAGDRGTGLGLSLAQSIAQAHGGSAYAANRPGGGADVWLVIPLQFWGVS